MAKEGMKYTINWKGEDYKKLLGMKMKDTMKVVCIKIASDAKANIGSGSSPKVVSGTLRNSIGWAVSGGASRQGLRAPNATFPVVKGVVGSILEYAKVLELGTGYLPGNAITPKVSRALAIPLNPSLTGTGAQRTHARDVPNTFVKNGIVFQKVGDLIVPMFVLKRKVRIPPHPFLRPAFDGNQGFIKKSLKDM